MVHTMANENFSGTLNPENLTELPIVVTETMKQNIWRRWGAYNSIAKIR